MPEYGFTSSDINSMTSARAGLTAGFMQLGKQIQEDITRIATMREMKAFGQELASLDPTSDAFPQQLIGTMSKYPLASQTPLARNGISLLGERYKASIEARTKVNEIIDLGGGVKFRKGVGTYQVNPETGAPEFIDTTPQERPPLKGTVIQTPEGQKLINPVTGEQIAEYGPKPSASGPRSSNVLTAQLRQLDNTIKGHRIERQKLLDKLSVESGGTTYEGAAALPYLRAEDPQLLRIKQLESEIQKVTDEAREITKSAYSGGSAPTSPVGQDDLALMPSPQQQSPFVPMGMPTNIAAPQMTLNTGQNYIEPPVLPGVTPPPKQAGTPRGYQIQGGKFRILSGNPKAAIEQAYADQVITEEQRTRYLGSLQ